MVSEADAVANVYVCCALYVDRQVVGFADLALFSFRGAISFATYLRPAHENGELIVPPFLLFVSFAARNDDPP